MWAGKFVFGHVEVNEDFYSRGLLSRCEDEMLENELILNWLLLVVILDTLSGTYRFYRTGQKYVTLSYANYKK